MNAYPTFIRCVVAAFLVFSLSSCGLFSRPEPVAKPPKPVAEKYTAREYVAHLAFARLDPASDEDDLKIVRGYAAQKETKLEIQPVLMIEYKLEGDAAMRQVVVPLPANKETISFPTLFEVMSYLTPRRYTLYNLYGARVGLSPQKVVMLPDAGAEGRQIALDLQTKKLFERAARMSPRDDVPLQMRLARFFMKHRFRDAAYLAVDNAKQQLALFPANDPASAALAKQYTLELEDLEATLHKELPYRL